jgi:SAM-dependent methyltransferase
VSTHFESRQRLSFEERVLLAFARNPDAPAIGATASYTVDNCLDFARKTIHRFDEQIHRASVLDYGCGPGWQAVAMHTQCGASRVLGIDIDDTWLMHGRALASAHGCADTVTFEKYREGLVGAFDVVVSLSAFEHYADPSAELQRMRSLLKTGGRILLSFAEPWYSHSGSHIGDFTRVPGTNRPIPWVNLLFSDRALLTLRGRFRADRPRRVEDIEGGLNRMTLARFEREIRRSGLRIVEVQYFATAGLPLVTRVPVLRELLTSAASCVLQRVDPPIS